MVKSLLEFYEDIREYNREWNMKKEMFRTKKDFDAYFFHRFLIEPFRKRPQEFDKQYKKNIRALIWYYELELTEEEKEEERKTATCVETYKYLKRCRNSRT